MSIAIPYFITFFLVFLRLSSLFFMVPAFGGSFLPAQIRIMMGLLITVLIVPNVEILGFESISVWEIAFYGLGEVLVGLFMGICVRAFFAIMEVAGQIISRNIGLMMAEQFDPSSGANSNLIGVILFYFGTILFFMVGGHHHMIYQLVQSFQVVGLAKETLIVGNVLSIATVLSQIFELAVSISAPFIAVNFIITLGFGVLGKVAPKINVMLISFSFRIVGGLIVFTITANLLFNFLIHYSEEIPRSMLEFLSF